MLQRPQAHSRRGRGRWLAASPIVEKAPASPIAGVPAGTAAGGLQGPHPAAAAGWRLAADGHGRLQAAAAASVGCRRRRRSASRSGLQRSAAVTGLAQPGSLGPGRDRPGALAPGLAAALEAAGPMQ